ncbi:unnamed protein product [Prunus armeniaca]|uniref:NB-ARC domain-containing protein n=1 Tax=Prunus armeniaca TaxID=36596 RepID=A0A6J5VT56_PRUAR|nr:unnamed protein product [Prunus armeniaca]
MAMKKATTTPRMKALQARFDEILKGGTALHLLATVSQTTERIPRDVDKEKIQDMLLWDGDHEHQQQEVRVIALVGMGGIGKTALATSHVQRRREYK